MCKSAVMCTYTWFVQSEWSYKLRHKLGLPNSPLLSKCKCFSLYIAYTHYSQCTCDPNPAHHYDNQTKPINNCYTPVKVYTAPTVITVMTHTLVGNESLNAQIGPCWADDSCRVVPCLHPCARESAPAPSPWPRKGYSPPEKKKMLILPPPTFLLLWCNAFDV